MSSRAASAVGTTPAGDGSPTITIAIPFYRNLHYLDRAITSVRAQEHGHWQLIVRDDAGPEHGTARLVESYADDRISYVRNETNLGLAGNWNRCLDRADTDLVTLLHADDELAPRYVGTVVSTHARTDVAAVYTRATIIGPGGDPTASLPDLVKRVVEPKGGADAVIGGEAGLVRLLRANFIICPTLCYRRARVGPAPFDTRWRQVMDLHLTCRLLLDEEQIIGAHDPVYRYRRHPESETEANNASLLRFREQAALFDEIAAAATARGWSRAARYAERKRIMWLNLASRAAADTVRGRWHELSAKAALARSLAGAGPDPASG